jgi:hypothetical protein
MQEKSLGAFLKIGNAPGEFYSVTGHPGQSWNTPNDKIKIGVCHQF